ncbi:MAG: cytochrome c oxidase subunit II [Methylocystis sp.]|nr:cytochrome c oxidase subunit II [Methylocystis sp.]
MIVALVFLLLAVGTVLFHFLSPWWWTPIASNWGYIDDTMIIMFSITGVVCIAIILFMAYSIFRFHHQEGRRAAYEPENTKLELGLALATAVGIGIMLAPGLLVWNLYITVPKGALEVEVVGQQWQWSYRFPGKDNRLGASDVRFVGTDNPLGLNPNDPYGRDDIVVVGDDLHLPVGRPVKLLLRSLDVVHDFYVPEFRAKMDLMPGMVTYFWLTPARIATFDILCAGYCGVGHPQMRGKVVIQSESDYQTWLAAQKTFAQLRESGAAERRASAR